MCPLRAMVVTRSDVPLDPTRRCSHDNFLGYNEEHAHDERAHGFSEE